MTPTSHTRVQLSPEIQAFYQHAIDLLPRYRLPFLVGGAYALARYTGIKRDTKDFDLFVRPADQDAVLQAFESEGYTTDRPFPHWLAKVYRVDHVVDVIFSSGNGVVQVDDEWFTHASKGIVLDRQVLLCPPEEMLWSKAFIMERERFDGADINHLLHACMCSLDWPRLLRRFGPHWRLLLAHLILFGYVYPAEVGKIPAEVMQILMDRLRQEQGGPVPRERVCQGTLLSRAQYLIDVEEWGYRDARLVPQGPMSPDDVATWTAAIGNDNPALEQ